jgi:hypothetical protein
MRTRYDRRFAARLFDVFPRLVVSLADEVADDRRRTPDDSVGLEAGNKVRRDHEH